ncbi:hypothetical protein BH09MYX1_BH09MYX1_27240 [soil metagenome]
MRRAISAGAFSVVALLWVAVATTAPACLPQGECDAHYEVYCTSDDTRCASHNVDETTWQSSAINGRWLKYSGQETIRISPRDPNGIRIKGRLVKAEAWISACERPSDDGCNFASAAGNNAEYHWVDLDGRGGSLTITNATCESYYVRVVITSDGSDLWDIKEGAFRDASSTADAQLSSDGSADASTD